MGLEPDARLVVNRDVDLRSLPLTPIDFFLFSRVEALSGRTPPTVADVVAASGQPADSARAALERLLEFELISTSEVPDATVRKRARQQSAPASAHNMRDRAQSRRRELLEAQMRMATGAQSRAKSDPARAPTSGAKAPAEDPEEVSLPTPRDRAPTASSSAVRSILDEVEPVAESDPRLRHDAGVDLDRQRRLLALRDRLRHIGHFELLGLEPIDDPKAIRRAYHVVSREFHPDSFYGKNVGTFRAVLDDLFRRARASYEFLLDDERRKPLVEAHLAQARAERDRHERERAQAQTEAEAAADRARIRAEADAAEEAREAREARAKRDGEHQNRIRDRALRQRRKEAKKHADQAAREREVGRHGTAATLFRLAFEQDPSKPEYEQLWRESLSIARRQRADSSFERGRQARKAGRMHEAARHLALAADADPSLRNLAEAAGAMAEVDVERGHELAMTALESLQQAKARGLQLDPRVVANVHQACAKAFLAAGQHASAKEQAERAHQLAPSDKTRTLLNSIKLT